MGVEHYLVCHECKEYIDLHKVYKFNECLRTSDTPPQLEFDDNGGPKTSLNNQWTVKGIWFLWAHRGHSNIKMHSDHDDDWFSIEPWLTEVVKSDSA